MDIELFTLCEYASNTNGALTIVNTLDSFSAPKFPWRVYFGIALKANIISSLNDTSTIAFKIFKDDREDEAIFNTEIPVKDVKGRFTAAGNIKGLILSSDGKYCFRVSLNGNTVKDYFFYVQKKR